MKILLLEDASQCNKVVNGSNCQLYSHGQSPIILGAAIKCLGTSVVGSDGTRNGGKCGNIHNRHQLCLTTYIISLSTTQEAIMTDSSTSGQASSNPNANYTVLVNSLITTEQAQAIVRRLLPGHDHSTVRKITDIRSKGLRCEFLSAFPPG